MRRLPALSFAAVLLAAWSCRAPSIGPPAISALAPEVVFTAPRLGQVAGGSNEAGQAAVYFSAITRGLSEVFELDRQTGNARLLASSTDFALDPICLAPMMSRGTSGALQGGALIVSSGQELQWLEARGRLAPLFEDQEASRWIGFADSRRSFWVQRSNPAEVRLEHVLAGDGRGMRRTVWSRPGDADVLALGPGGRWLCSRVGRELQLQDLQRPGDEPTTLSPAPEPGSVHPGEGAAFSADTSRLWYVGATEQGNRLFEYDLGLGRSRPVALAAEAVRGVVVLPPGANRPELRGVRVERSGSVSLQLANLETGVAVQPPTGAALLNAWPVGGSELGLACGSFADPHWTALWAPSGNTLTPFGPIDPSQWTPALSQPLPSALVRADPALSKARVYSLARTRAPEAGPWVLWVAANDARNKATFEPLARALLEAGIRILLVPEDFDARALARSRRALVDGRLADPQRIGLVGSQGGGQVVLSALEQGLGGVQAVVAIDCAPRDSAVLSERDIPLLLAPSAPNSKKTNEPAAVEEPSEGGLEGFREELPRDGFRLGREIPRGPLQARERELFSLRTEALQLLSSALL